jgi:hypothetical protein
MSDAAHTNGNGATTNGGPSHGNLLSGIRGLALLAGIGGLVGLLILFGILTSMGEAQGQKQLFQSYLTGFFFWFCIGIGSQFFLGLQYFTGGRWGILMRRPFEANSRTLLLGFVLFFAGANSPYWWAAHSHAHEDEKTAKKEERKATIEELKEGAVHYRQSIEKWNTEKYLRLDLDKKCHDYLNPTFSALRAIGIFAVLGLCSLVMNRLGDKAEKNKDPRARVQLKFAGTISTFVFALATTVLVTDWIMSLEETFASSMFPVIVFANAMICSWAIGLLTLLHLKKHGHEQYKRYFTAGEQIHVGSFLLAMTLFWTYTNFSQFMLIWIGNLPEEIPYYLKRLNGGWQYVGMLMIAFHFVVPFLLLLFRDVKSNPVALKWICCGLLCICFVDVFWWIAPSPLNLHKDQSVYWLMDIAAWIGVGGVWIWYYLGQFAKNPPLPTEEVYLLEAYHHGH